MKITAPLSDIDFGDWLTQLKDNGVPPKEVLELFKDLSRFGYVSVGQDSITKYDQLNTLRTTVCDVLKTLTTPDDVANYTKNKIAVLYPHLLPLMGDEDTNKSVVADHQKKMVVVKYLIKRELYADPILFSNPNKCVEWIVNFDPKDIKVTWDDVFSYMKSTIPQVEGLSEELTNKDQLFDRINQLPQTGLSELSWPAIVGFSPKTAGFILENVLESNRLLQQRTQWDGPVLGLNKKVSLRIGMDMSGNSGTCYPTNSDSNIFSFCQTPIDVIAHEWFHALDFALSANNGELLSEDENAENNPWKSHIDELVNGLRSNRFTGTVQDIKNVQKMFLQNIKELFKNAHYPDEIIPVFEKALTVNLPFEKQRQLFEDCLKQNGYFLDKSTQASVMLYCNLELFKDLQNQLESGKSLWIEYAERLAQNFKCFPEYNDLGSYLLLPSEQLAHSFEVTDDVDGKVCFTSHIQSFRYPQEHERLDQKIHWKRFFKNISAWWDEQKPAADEGFEKVYQASEPVSIVSKIQDRRQKAVPNVEQNDFSMAAKNSV